MLRPKRSSPSFRNLALMTAGLLAAAGATLAGQAGSSRPAADTALESPPLELGKVYRRELSPGQTHRYTIRLEAGQFVSVVVDQKGIDVALSVLDEKGKKVCQMDVLDWGTDWLSWVADSAGIYTVEAASYYQDPLDSLPGSYEIEIHELRPEGPTDRLRIRAEALLAEAALLQVDADAADANRKALEKLESCLQLWQELRDQRGQATAHYLMGRVRSNQGDSREAVRQFELSLPLWRAVGERYGEALSLFLGASCEARIGLVKEAFDHVQTAIEIEHALGNRSAEAEVIGYRGMLHDSVGEKQSALEDFLEALPLLHETRGRIAEEATFNNIAALYDSLGEKQKALDFYRQAIDLSRQLGRKYAEAIARGNLGSLFSSLGESEAAFREWDQALAIAKKGSDRTLEARILTKMGQGWTKQGQYDRAMESFSKAMSILQDGHDLNRQSSVLLSLGELHLALNNPEGALEGLRRALDLTRQLGARDLEAAARTDLGSAHRLLRHFEEASGELQAALQIRQEIQDRLGEASTAFELARLERERGDFVAARRRTEEVLELVESLRGRVASQELRASYLASAREPFEFYVDLLTELHRRDVFAGFDAQALEVSEQTHARSLMEILAESGRPVREGADPALLAREQSLDRLLNGKVDAQIRMLSRKHSQQEAEAAAKEIDSLTVQHRQVRDQMRTTSPRYATWTEPRPLGLAEIRSRVLDEHSLLLEFLLGEEHSHLWAVSKDSLKIYELPPRSQIEPLTRELYGLLTARNRHEPGETTAGRNTRIARADRESSSAAASLSRMILGPAAPDLGARRLLIVADGALQYLPFAVLPVPSGVGSTGLGAEHDIVSLPSASVLAVLRAEIRQRPPAPKTLAVLADPVFDEDDARLREAGRKPISQADGAPSSLALSRSIRDVPDDQGAVRRLGRLPFSHREADAILAEVAPSERLAYLGFDADLAAATGKDLSRFRYVHFATHGLLDSRNPELSGLVLSLFDRTGKSKEGFLPAFDVYNLRLTSDLVALSACRTGLGKEIKGEGLVGLTRGFMYAGAARVLVSLWGVDDAATAELMSSFYGEMFGPRHLSPARALRSAQIAISRKKRWQAPYYWAGFILQGEPD
jgi:CHAT domain-containing protein/tetratricopeptide (TPR) repeat protein